MLKKLTIALVLLGLVVSSCTMEIPSPDVIINEVKDDQSGGGGDLTPESLQAPVVSPSLLNSTNGNSVAVSLNLPPNSPLGTVIHYTLDGTDPETSMTASLYTTPFTVSGTGEIIVVRSVAFDGVDYSTGSTGVYWFGDWEVVGDNYIAETKPRMLAAENGIIYVAKRDSSFTPQQLIIQHTTVGNTWTELPAISEFGCGEYNPWYGGNYAKAFFVEAGVPYVACNAGNPGVFVKKFVGGSWITLGGTNAPIEDPVDVILKVSNGVTYLAGVDHGSWKVNAYYFDGTNWQAMGPQPLMPTNTTRIGFDVINNVPYIAYASPTGLTVKKFDFNTNAWIDLNTGVTQMGNAYYVDLAVDDNGTPEGVPYVIFRDINSDTRIIKYENETWSYVGGITPSSQFIKVNDGIPYISTLVANKMLVKRFYGGVWQNVGTSTYYNVGQFDTSMEIDPVTGNIHTYYNTTIGGVVESFGPNGSGVPAHIDDPLGCPGC